MKLAYPMLWSQPLHKADRDQAVSTAAALVRRGQARPLDQRRHVVGPGELQRLGEHLLHAASGPIDLLVTPGAGRHGRQRDDERHLPPGRLAGQRDQHDAVERQVVGDLDDAGGPDRAVAFAAQVTRRGLAAVGLQPGGDGGLGRGGVAGP